MENHENDKKIELDSLFFQVVSNYNGYNIKNTSIVKTMQ